MNNDEREMRIAIDREIQPFAPAGVVHDYDRSGRHNAVRIRLGDAQQTVFFAKTASDWRAKQNTVAEVRRALSRIGATQVDIAALNLKRDEERKAAERAKLDAIFSKPKETVVTNAPLKSFADLPNGTSSSQAQVDADDDHDDGEETGGNRFRVTLAHAMQVAQLLTANGKKVGSRYTYNEGWHDMRIAQIIAGKEHAHTAVHRIKKLRRESFGLLAHEWSNTGSNLKGNAQLNQRVSDIESKIERIMKELGIS